MISQLIKGPHSPKMHCVDCKTVVFFANASDGVGPSWNERSGASVKTARENGERRLRACEARATLEDHAEARATLEDHAYCASRLPKQPKTTVLQYMHCASRSANLNFV